MRKLTRDGESTLSKNVSWSLNQWQTIGKVLAFRPGIDSSNNLTPAVETQRYDGKDELDRTQREHKVHHFDVVKVLCENFSMWSWYCE